MPLGPDDRMLISFNFFGRRYHPAALARILRVLIRRERLKYSVTTFSIFVHSCVKVGIYQVFYVRVKMNLPVGNRQPSLSTPGYNSSTFW